MVNERTLFLMDYCQPLFYFIFVRHNLYYKLMWPLRDYHITNTPESSKWFCNFELVYSNSILSSDGSANNAFKRVQEFGTNIKSSQ